MRFHRFNTGIVATVLATLVLPSSALAYVGPGAGITAIGSVLALLAGVVLAIIGFLWYPLKRLFRSRRSEDEQQSTMASNAPADDESPEDSR